MSGTPSYSLKSDVRSLVGIQPEAAAIKGPKAVADQVSSILRSRFGPCRGEVQVQVGGSGLVEVSFFPDRRDDRAERLHQEAIPAARAKDLQTAVRKWEEAARLNPTDPKYSFHAGVANFELRRYEQAKAQLQHTLELCPFHHRAHLVLGTLFLKLRKLDQAERHLELAVELAPDDPLAHLNLGAVYSVLRKYDKGTRQFEEAIRLRPNDPRPYLGLAKVYSLLGRHERAEYYYRQVIKLDKDGGLRKQAQRNLTLGAPVAVSHRQTGYEGPQAPTKIRRPEAELDRATQTVAPEPSVPTSLVEIAKHASKYAQQDPDTLFAAAYRSYLTLDYPRALEYYAAYCGRRHSDPSGWFGLGENALRTGKLRLAAEAFEKAASIGGKPSHFKQLGLVHVLLAEYEQAETYLRRARELGKGDSLLLTLLAECALARKAVSEAIPLLQEAVRANRNNLRARINLAKALAEHGDVEEAVRQLDEILLLPVDSPIRSEAERLLDELREERVKRERGLGFPA